MHHHDDFSFDDVDRRTREGGVCFLLSLPVLWFFSRLDEGDFIPTTTPRVQTRHAPAQLHPGRL